MNKNFLTILFFIFSLTLNAQSKKEQIIELNVRVDSLLNSLTVLKNKSDVTIAKLNEQISICKTDIRNLNNELDYINKNLEKKNIELDITRKSLELAKLVNSSWFFDTIHVKVTHSCYYYESDFPYIISSTSNDSIRKKINKLIRETSFKIPAIMQNEDYKNFRKCEEGDYDHLIAAHNQHATNLECNWCQSEFYSSVMNIEQSSYLSILMTVSYTAGGNWAHVGYNSLNFKNNKIITIPTSLSVKNKLIEEIKDYLLNNPLIDIDGDKYPIINEIQKWNIDDLTFYFKNDTLRIVFVNGAHGLWNQTFDIPLPKLQQYLNL
jgi:hypothetical protein